MAKQEHDQRRAPIRMCIGCRAHRPQSQLVRCAWTPDGPVVGRAAEGRGAWLCSAACFDTALRRHAFGRAWRRDVAVSTLDTLRIPFERVITNMRDLPAAGTTGQTAQPGQRG